MTMLYDLGVMFPLIATGDVDGDGLSDALVSGANGTKVLLGRASGPFAQARPDVVAVHVDGMLYVVPRR